MAFAFYVQQNTSALSDFSEIFIFDAVNDIREHLANSITKYSVAKSSDMTDHVQPQNNTIDFIGYINENPVPNNLGNTTSTNTLETSGSSRIAIAESKLRDLRSNGTTFSFIKKNIVYKNCVISSIDIETSEKTGGMLVARISLEQIRTASTSTEVSTVIEDDTVAETSTGNSGKTTTSESRVWGTIKSYFSDLID